MRILLLTTCDLASGRHGELERLTDSLVASARGSVHDIVQVLLLQRADAGTAARMNQTPLPFRRICLYAGGRLPLAAARNAMLRFSVAEGLLASADWLAFPDDDAWYPPGLVSRVSEVFAHHPDVVLATCHYGSEPVSSRTSSCFRARPPLGSLVRVFSSNTLFVRRSAVDRAGVYFDERLGLGACINGGEDLDYALRIAALGGEVAYDPACRVGHRDRLPWVRGTYFEGSLCALARGAAVDQRLRPSLWRKFGVGAALVIKGELPPRRLVDAWRVARPFGYAPAQVQADAEVMERAGVLPVSSGAVPA